MSIITIRGIPFETVYDNSNNISTPVVCSDETPTINNINLSGLKTVVEQNPNNIWGVESLSDFQDLLENEPADKIFVTVGEIILSPHNNPDVYYLFKQQKNKNGKTYLFIEKLKSTEKPKRVKKVSPMKKPEDKKIKKSAPEVIKLIRAEKTSPKSKMKREKKEEDFQINPECFFMMRMAEALTDYVKLTYPNDLKKYKKIVK